MEGNNGGKERGRGYLMGGERGKLSGRKAADFERSSQDGETEAFGCLVKFGCGGRG